MIQSDIQSHIKQVALEYAITSIMEPRQSGKTILIEERFKDYQYVNLEYPDLRRAAQGVDFIHYATLFDS